MAGEAAIPGPPGLFYFQNQGTPQNPQFTLITSDLLPGIFSQFAVCLFPLTADIDADGDLDLFITDDHGHFYYYQNNGTPQWPIYTLVSAQWQGIQFYYPEYGWRGFCFADLDEDGDLDLLMENVVTSVPEFNLRFYRNAGTAQSPNMVLETNFFLPQYWIYRPCPYLVDIDLDGDLDLFCSDESGGIQFFRNITGDSTGAAPRHPSTAPYRGPVLSIGPNPANPLTVISCQLLVASNISLEIFDISGKKVVDLASGFHLPGEYRYVWDASKNASGMYVVRLRAGEEKMIEKVVMLK